MKLPPIVAADGSSHDAELQVIEWRAETKRILYLCSKNGFPLDQFETKFHVPGFSFSAYLRSSYVEQLQNESRLGLADLDPPLAGAIERARSEIKDYFRNRAAEKARTVVEVWKADEVYPYVGEPQSTVEKAERQVFDIVAVHVQELAPEIGLTSAMARALHLPHITFMPVRTAAGKGSRSRAEFDRFAEVRLCPSFLRARALLMRQQSDQF